MAPPTYPVFPITLRKFDPLEMLFRIDFKSSGSVVTRDVTHEPHTEHHQHTPLHIVILFTNSKKKDQKNIYLALTYIHYKCVTMNCVEQISSTRGDCVFSGEPRDLPGPLNTANSLQTSAPQKLLYIRGGSV